MSMAWGKVDDTLEEAGSEVSFDTDPWDELAVATDAPSYTDIAKEYVADLWETGKNHYLGHQLSGIDRLQDTATKAVASYSPEVDNPHMQALADNAAEFGRSFAQAFSGGITVPAAIYDGVQEYWETGEPPLSPYVQMEEYRENPGSFAEKAGKAAGFATAATAGVQYPILFAAGAAHNFRHYLERQLHHHLQDTFIELAEDESIGELEEYMMPDSPYQNVFSAYTAAS